MSASYSQIVEKGRGESGRGEVIGGGGEEKMGREGETQTEIENDKANMEK